MKSTATTIGVGIRLHKTELDRLGKVGKERGFKSRNAAIRAAIIQFLKSEEAPRVL